MATYTKQKLSASTDGRPILVTATSIASGTTIHTGSATASTYDEVWLYAMNDGTSSIVLTVGWGGTTDPNDLIVLTLLPQAGLVTVAPGLLIKGNATPLVIRASAGTGSLVTIHGFVNQIEA